MIVQIHTFKNNVSISYNRNSETSLDDNIFGTNIGLFVDTTGKSFIDFRVKNNNTEIIEALFAVVAYTSQGKHINLHLKLYKIILLLNQNVCDRSVF